MSRTLRAADGTFAGSVGEGHTRIPTPATEVRTLAPAGPAGVTNAVSDPRWMALYERYAEAVTHPPTGLLESVREPGPRPTAGN
jgi:hypothetical protein